MVSPEIEALVANAIKEDIGNGDHTSLACIPSGEIRKAELLCKENGVLAGVELAVYVLRTFSDEIEVEVIKKDGHAIVEGDVILTVKGPARSILGAERLVLNFMQRMSGIATRTYKLVETAKRYGCQILDTRKTTPGIRSIEKWAVKIGGGVNHRFGLYDMIMIKDNHIDYAGGIEKAIMSTKNYLADNKLDLKIIVEARNLNEVKEILQFDGVYRILLDNFKPEMMKEAVRLIGNKCLTEASGGIDESNIEKYAATGVNFISVGAITHQIHSLDMSLKAVK